MIRRIGTDSVVVVAGEMYAAGGFHRWLLGDNYRDEWTTPITVPVLDLKIFSRRTGADEDRRRDAGQVAALRRAGQLRVRFPPGAQDKPLPQRPVQAHHHLVHRPRRGQRIPSNGRDRGGSMLAVAGVLHPSPRLYYMPDDPLLGEFRKEFARHARGGRGASERSEEGSAFADADKIIDSEELLEAINKDPKTRSMRARC